MTLSIKASGYKAIQDVVLKAKARVNKTSFWKQIHNELGIGIEAKDHFSLSASDRLTLSEKIKDVTGFDPRKDKYADLTSQTRTENSAGGYDEKLFSQKPREPFVEVRYCFEAITSGYMGLTVDDALRLAPDVIVSIENFDTFVTITRDYALDYLLSERPSKRVLFVYRGDNVANPKALQHLRSCFAGEWIHFGDFDPQGLRIGIIDMKADKIIIPDFTELSLLLQQYPLLNRRENYNAQRSALMSLCKIKDAPNDVVNVIEHVKRYKLAVMQEPLYSRFVKLTLLALR